MTDAGGAVPGGVEVIFHVRVISEEFPVRIEAAVEDVAEADGDGFPIRAVGIELIDDAAGSEASPVAAGDRLAQPPAALMVSSWAA